MEAAGTLGDQLRHWRRVRGKSQLELAVEAMTTPRYVSFVETGRSQPSRRMVVRLARALDVPLRERNGLLLAAGYAPLYRAAPLEDPDLERVRGALEAMLAKHEPFPAVVMDRGWNVLRANGGAQRLFGGLCAPDPLPEPANVLELMIGPGPVRAAVRNWEQVVPGLLDRCRREAVGGVLDAATAERLARLRVLPEVASLADAPSSPVFDVEFLFEGAELRFFSVVSTIGTPTDVTAQELRVEAFFPGDRETEARWATPL
ncbi:MAG: helix-turn-helix transcriptional regulator [Solirubrobacteraceae bacterium]|nr:helix-turn-helix transcriptional regulator [Solirubrobacteraceae bacterium]